MKEIQMQYRNKYYFFIQVYKKSAAAIWWNRLSHLKKEFFVSKYGKITDEKINEIYKIHTDWSSEDLEQVSSCC